MVLCQQTTPEYKRTQQMNFSYSRMVQSGSIKVLGLHANSKLSWPNHIDERTKKLTSTVFNIRRMKYVRCNTTDVVCKLPQYSHVWTIVGGWYLQTSKEGIENMMRPGNKTIMETSFHSRKNINAPSLYVGTYHR